MNNKTEQINGTLEYNGREWLVSSGYGGFPLSEGLSVGLDEMFHGSEVQATVKHGIVTKYHFASKFTDNPKD